MRWSVSNALRTDEWVMLEELWRFHDGRYPLSYLWQPYWGHRAVIPRLVMLVDERFFGYSNVVLAALNLAAQCASLVVLSCLVWRLLAAKGRWLAVLGIAVSAHFLLSALQMENFAYGMGMQYTLFVLFSLGALWAMGKTRFGTSMICATGACLCLGSGLILFPALVFEATAWRAKRWMVWTIAGVGLCYGAAYAAGYNNAGEGMGMLEMLRRPWSAALVASMFLGGPVSNIALGWGEAVGVLGLVAAAYAGFRLWRSAQRRTESVVLTGLVLYLAAVAFSIALGRITPEWLAAHGAGPLPSRYFTIPFLFWAALFALAASWGVSVADRVAFGAVCAGVLGLTVGMVKPQMVVSESWFHYYRRMDAAAGGLIVGAGDQLWMSTMYPDQHLLDHWSSYLRERRLGVFAEPRARWMGARFEGLAMQEEQGCGGAIEQRTNVENGAERVEGHVRGPGVSMWRKSDVVLVGTDGMVAGIARTLGESDGAVGERFAGYVREGVRVTPYLVDGASTACRLGAS